jgi:hypothetical protein
MLAVASLGDGPGAVGQHEAFLHVRLGNDQIVARLHKAPGHPSTRPAKTDGLDPRGPEEFTEGGERNTQRRLSSSVKSFGRTFDHTAATVTSKGKRLVT